MSNNQPTKAPRSRRTTAAALLIAAGAMSIGGLGSAVSANAAPADAYVALSFNLATHKSGVAVSANSETARVNSLTNCGGGCTTYVIAHNTCAALAYGTDPLVHQEWSTAENSIIEMARKQALSKNGGGMIGVSACTTNLVVDPPPEQSPTEPTQPSDPNPPPPPPAPVDNDYDHDGLSRHDELVKYHTNPLVADTDFDGVNDGVEITNGTNPLNHFSV